MTAPRHPNGIDEICICHEHKPVCDCRHVGAAAIARQDDAELNDSQRGFLRFLNGPWYVAEWKKLFQGATVQAVSSKGRRATLTLSDVDDLISLGYLQSGWGASYILTDKGKKVI